MARTPSRKHGPDAWPKYADRRNKRFRSQRRCSGLSCKLARHWEHPQRLDMWLACNSPPNVVACLDQLMGDAPSQAFVVECWKRFGDIPGVTDLCFSKAPREMTDSVPMLCFLEKVETAVDSAELAGTDLEAAKAGAVFDELLSTDSTLPITCNTNSLSSPVGLLAAPRKQTKDQATERKARSKAKDAGPVLGPRLSGQSLAGVRSRV